MGINVDDLKEYVIQPTLKQLGLYSVQAEQLLLGTIAAESDMGMYLHQVKGPALGIYQMEPDTYGDIWLNYLKYHPGFVGSIEHMGYHVRPPVDAWTLVTDLRYSTIMARLQYYRHTEELPQVNDVQAQAEYWKKYYNTSAGAGTVKGYIAACEAHRLFV